MRRRSRSRSDRGTLGRVALVFLFLAAIGVAGAVVVPSISFSNVDETREAQFGIGADGNGLLGIDLAESVSVGDSGPFDCTVTGTTVVVTSQLSGGIDTEHGVVVESGASVGGPITADGCVVVESGGRAFSDVTAGGDVTIDSGAQVEGDIEAGGNLVVYSGGRALESVDVGGSVTLASGAQIDGDADVGGDVTMDSGARILGDVDSGGSVTLASGAQIDGDVEVDGPGQISIPPGARVLGDVDYSGGEDDSDGVDADSAVFLVEMTNNVGRELWVTISLTDPADGHLFAGAQSGSTVSVWLGSGTSTSIDVAPSSDGGDEIEFEITGTTDDGNTAITLTRSVEKA